MKINETKVFTLNWAESREDQVVEREAGAGLDVMILPRQVTASARSLLENRSEHRAPV